jgi:hypothetical protein
VTRTQGSGNVASIHFTHTELCDLSERWASEAGRGGQAANHDFRLIRRPWECSIGMDTTITVPTAQQVNGLVAKWSRRHPELAERLERAAAMVANVTALDPNRNFFLVEGSNEHTYIVSVNRHARTSTCSCPDHENRSIRCKHILSVALIEAAQA